jgi:hypothetical protein
MSAGHGTVRRLDRGADRDAYCQQFDAAAAEMRVLRRQLTSGQYAGARTCGRHAFTVQSPGNRLQRATSRLDSFPGQNARDRISSICFKQGGQIRVSNWAKFKVANSQVRILDPSVNRWVSINPNSWLGRENRRSEIRRVGVQHEFVAIEDWRQRSRDDVDHIK